MKWISALIIIHYGEWIKVQSSPSIFWRSRCSNGLHKLMLLRIAATIKEQKMKKKLQLSILIPSSFFQIVEPVFFEQILWTNVKNADGSSPITALQLHAGAMLWSVIQNHFLWTLFFGFVLFSSIKWTRIKSNLHWCRKYLRTNKPLAKCFWHSATNWIKKNAQYHRIVAEYGFRYFIDIDAQNDNEQSSVYSQWVNKTRIFLFSSSNDCVWFVRFTKCVVSFWLMYIYTWTVNRYIV